MSKAHSLSLAEAVRKRPGMYFGDIDKDGANVPVYELISNAIDQFLAGAVSTIKISIENHKIIVSDDGGVLPFSEPAPDNSGKNLVEFYLSHHHNTPTADNHSPHVHVIGGGLGLAILNAGAETLLIKSSDGDQQWQQTFGKGKILTPLSCTKGSFPKGSTIELTLDKTVFGNNRPNYDALRKTAFELVHLYPKLTIALQDEVFKSNNGLIDLANLLIKNPTACDEKHKKFSFTGKKNGIEIQVALLGEAKKKTQYFSWVNGLSSVDGGTHIDGLKQALANTSWKPQAAMIHIIMHDPEYARPSKDYLATEAVAITVEELLQTPLANKA